jgi:3-hydroxyacyl-CoA dehydrogenase
VLDKALKRLESLLDKDVTKKRITAEEADGARGRLKGVEGDGTGSDLQGTDLVIEVSYTTVQLM